MWNNLAMLTYIEVRGECDDKTRGNITDLSGLYAGSMGKTASQCGQTSGNKAGSGKAGPLSDRGGRVLFIL